MALNIQLWIRQIQENFYPNDSFASKSVDDSAYVNASKVHIPNAGAPSKVEKNRQNKPAQVGQRTDQDLEYTIDEFTTNPIHISNIEEVELSYDKRNSVLMNDRSELQRVAHMSLLERWADGAGSKVKTSGKSIKAHTYDGATGNRKGVAKADVLALMTLFNKQEIPAENRFLLLDADMYASLLADLTEADKMTFLASANAQTGVLGNLYGFSVLQRSTVLRTKADGETLLFEGELNEDTELAAGLAWQQNCVSRAMGEVKMFSSENNPAYYGDIYSFLVRTGGSHRRYDKKGVALLVETTV